MRIPTRPRRWRAARAAVASIVLFAAAVPVSPALAQQPNQKAVEAARARYEKGKQLFGEGAYDAALAELQRAYELAPSYKILYNIATVQRARNDFAGALAAYEKYLADGGKDVPAARKQEVQKELEALRTLVVKVELKVNVADADITINDAPAGKSPLASLVLNPGTHRIAATKEGRQPAVKVIKVAGGDSVAVELDLPEAAPGAPTGTGTPNVPPATTDTGSTSPAPTDSPTDTGTPPPPPPSRGPVWVGWIVTGALAVGAGVTGGLAMSQASAHADLRKKADVTPEEIESSRNGAKTLALVTDVLIPAAVVAGALSLYFTVRTVPASKAGSTTLRVGGSPFVGPTGVNGAAGTVYGTF